MDREMIEKIRAELVQHQVFADRSEDQPAADLLTQVMRFQINQICDLALLGLGYTPPEEEARHLLIRATAYLPVPATVTRDGMPMGVKVPDVHQQPAVERLRQEIHAYLKRSQPQKERS